MHIREASSKDWDNIWPIFREIVATGDTYAYEADTDSSSGKSIWMETPLKTYVVEDEGLILATYYIKTNQAGPGRHVCNCGYMVASSARGRGLATMMCKHSQVEAVKLGYRAMQFNFVASSNAGAVKLWKKLGFETVGTLPNAFKHPEKGYLDALVMYKWLT